MIKNAGAICLALCLLTSATSGGEKDAPALGTQPIAQETKSSDDDPIRASGRAPADPLRPGALFEATLTLQVPSSYVIHSLHAPAPAIATSLEIELPKGWEFAGDWVEPIAMPIGEHRHNAHSGEVAFTRKIRVTKTAVAGEYSLVARIRYQACTDKFCLRPVEKQLNLKVIID